MEADEASMMSMEKTDSDGHNGGYEEAYGEGKFCLKLSLNPP